MLGSRVLGSDSQLCMVALHVAGVYYRPKARNFPSVDAWILTERWSRGKRTIICNAMQYTISQNHGYVAVPPCYHRFVMCNNGFACVHVVDAEHPSYAPAG